MEYKKMREYSHEEFINLILGMNEEELLYFSENYGGYPVLFRMALDEKVSHIPFIQTGSSLIIVNGKGEILLQQRTDNGRWGLPGGCQELGEDLRDTAIREAFEETGIKLKRDDLVLIDNVSGKGRKRSYPNGDIVYNNTSLYLAKVGNDVSFKKDDESIKLEFISLDNLPSNLHDGDLIDVYRKSL